MLEDDSLHIDTESSKRKRNTPTKYSPRKIDVMKRHQPWNQLIILQRNFNCFPMHMKNKILKLMILIVLLVLLVLFVNQLKHNIKQYWHEIKSGFVYNGESICAKALCAPCGSTCGCKGGLWQCKDHIQLLQIPNISLDYLYNLNLYKTN